MLRKYFEVIPYLEFSSSRNICFYCNIPLKMRPAAVNKFLRGSKRPTLLKVLYIFDFIQSLHVLLLSHCKVGTYIVHGIVKLMNELQH